MSVNGLDECHLTLRGRRLLQGGRNLKRSTIIEHFAHQTFDVSNLLFLFLFRNLYGSRFLQVFLALRHQADAFRTGFEKSKFKDFVQDEHPVVLILVITATIVLGVVQSLLYDVFRLPSDDIVNQKVTLQRYLKFLQ